MGRKIAIMAPTMEARSVEAIVKALNEAGVRYIIVGGIAVNAHGYQRFTNDVDLVISLVPENIILGLYTLKSVGYQPIVPISPEQFARPENRAAWRDEKGMLVLKLWSDEHRRTPVDVFIHEPFEFEEEWEKIVLQPVSPNGFMMPILAYDSLLRMKEEAGREKDQLDIISLRKLDPYRK